MNRKLGSYEPGITAYGSILDKKLKGKNSWSGSCISPLGVLKVFEPRRHYLLQARLAKVPAHIRPIPLTSTTPCTTVSPMSVCLLTGKLIPGSL